MPFACSICEQESTKICAFCTKDACDNHLCERCGCCSDCCECDVPLDEATAHPHAAPPVEAEPALTPEEAVSPGVPETQEAPSSEAQPLSPDEPPPEPAETSEV